MSIVGPDPTPLPRYPRGTLLLVGLAAATITAIGMSSIRGILAPVLLTLVLSICAHPVRVRLEKRGVPHGLATGSVILVVFALLSGFFYVVIVAISQFVSMLPGYAAEIHDLGVSLGEFLNTIGIGDAQIQAMTEGFTPSRFVPYLSGFLGSFFGIVGFLVIVLTMLILMSSDASYAHTILGQLSQRRPGLVDALKVFAANVRRYMIVTTVLGLVQGFLNTIALWILQVPAALLWGLLAFLCSFIPNIGYFFAITPPVVFGYLVGGWPTVIAVIIVYGVINGGVQSIIQPKAVGSAVSLNQTITFFSVLFWAVVIGPIGAILAIPLTLLARTFLVDSDPDVAWVRPAFGPTVETRRLLKAADVAGKNARKAKPPSSPRPTATQAPEPGHEG
ncbi:MULTISPECIES: AI-2E family transporter [unclassified Cryobacterium]|uniref:AI-2E family transporter n=1 Tax=unclassified Cryobacterium TaxID=2649013 RepID=UPI00106B4244|nr:MULTISPECIES: AI-2E family transporter [unclassified Cryobacterium]MEB0286350.1 AI-2E family transporter [Cryobacterium sp. 10S3]MEB0306300.1 AI-2E family transporter [Cryobacterium sp. 10I1]TFB96314.1 AI-2E family transporter [Cryobacterium sp. MDB2-A-1]TFC03425.1 AI-2E family transporter [Cryobacterium sp. MDB2-33-2]TFC12599.1 AI-2E family transporter [Cryobacterium sp. MDB2-A-2]